MNTIIYLRHIRDAKLCTKGARKWFEGHGLSWNDFLANGLPADELDKLNDALADRVTAIARKEGRDGEQ